MIKNRPVSIRMLRSLELFLKAHYEGESPLLLGFSGGHDSRALFELLDLAKARLKKRRPFTFLVAHLDHGWREESREEALQLKKMIEGRGYPFFFKRLEMPIGGRNLEEKFREARYTFFEEIYIQENCQALLLGHQADDQVETVLKRLFEGAHFTALGAMQTVSSRKGMNLWRPLLEFGREEILQFLQEKGISALDDRTNYDPTYLRARMRSELLPFLEYTFGKTIRGNIAELAKCFQQLRVYFGDRAKLHKVRTEKGLTVDFRQMLDLFPIEIEAALKILTQEEGLILGTRHIQQLARHIVDNVSNKRLEIQGKLLIVNRKHLYIIDKSPVVMNEI